MGNTTIRNTRVAAALLVALVAIAALFLVGPMAASAQDGGTITVSKVDEDGQPLKGAKLELQDKDGNVIESWTTDGSDKVISGLAYPHLYTLHEVSAPAGYEIAADQGVYLPAPAASAQPSGGAITMGNTGYSYGMAMGDSVVYCLDRTTLHDGRAGTESALLSEIASGSVNIANLENSDRIKNNSDLITGALLVGYPNDAAGIGKKYNLTPEEFNRVTQDILWKLVNNVEPGSFDTSAADYNAHKDPRFQLYYNELLEAARTIDTSNYEATVFWQNKQQPIVGASLTVREDVPPSATATMVNVKAPVGETQVTIEKKWEGASDADTLSATFQLLKDGKPYGDPVTLTESTGWTYVFNSLPDDGAYTVKETTATNGFELTADSPVKDSTSESTSNSTTVNTIREAAPEIGKSYVLHVESYNEKDKMNNIRVLSTPLSVDTNDLPVDGNIPPEMLWTLVDAGNGQFYLTNGNGQTVAFGSVSGSAASTLNAGLYQQPTGARMHLNDNEDGSYSIVSTYEQFGISHDFVFCLGAGQNGVKFIRATSSDAKGVGNKVRFYEPVTETVTTTSQVSFDKYVFTNKKAEEPTPTEGKIGTTVEGASDSAAASLTAEQAAAKTSLVDAIDYEGLVPGATYAVSGQLVEVEGGKVVEVIATATEDKVAEAADGTWQITFEFEAGALEPGKKYVVFETATLAKDGEGNPVDDGPTIVHENPDDLSQTVVVGPEGPKPTYNGKLATTVGGATASSAAQLVAGADGKITTDVIDTIDYSNLTQGATYIVSGTLVEVADGEVVKVVATAAEDKVAEAGSGQWTITFANVTLEAGKTYVVFEEAVNKENSEDSAEHKNPDDTAQTVVVVEPTPEEPTPTEGKIGTTVEGASDSTAASLTAEQAAAKTSLVDAIDYEGLVPGATYAVSGQLVEVEGGEVVEVIATATEDKVAEAADGTWQITFEFEAGALEPGKKYVVFETATLAKDGEGNPVDDGPTIVHENPDDLSQTVVVGPAPEEPNPNHEGSMKTTVKGATASSAAQLQANADGSITTDVVDTIDYEGLTPGATYTVSGQLIEVESGKAVAEATEEKKAEANNGSWEITFKDVTLKAGKTYVVFEEAVNNDNPNDTAEHKDINDQAQSVHVDAAPTPSDDTPTPSDDNTPTPSDDNTPTSTTDDEPTHPVKVTTDEGNKVVIVDENGKTVDEWTSDGKPHQTPLKPGTYTITITDKDGNKVDKTITVREDGTVVDSGGNPVPDASIELNPTKPDASTGTVKAPTVASGGNTATTSHVAGTTTAKTGDAAAQLVLALGALVAVSAGALALSRRRLAK